MKNLNLIKRLWTDSHEKQSPQRFARYAVMLIMLLTLGVGQMWADDCGFWGDGAASITFTVDGSSDKTPSDLNGTGVSDYSIGTVTTSLTIKSAWAKVWGRDKFNGITLYYRVKEADAASSAAYSSASLGWGNNFGSNDQFWQNTSINASIDIALAPGNYEIEYYFFADAKDESDKYLSNGSSNYHANFTIPSKNLTVSGAANGNTVSGSVTGITKGVAYDITATPTTGYGFTGWSTSDSHITIANTSSPSTTVTFNNYSANATVTAGFALESTHDVTVSYKNNNSQTIKANTTESNVGESTARSVTAPSINDHTFANWTLGAGIKNNSASTSANPISINTKASGAYTLQANYTLVPCSLYIHTSSGTFATQEAKYLMSYDPDVDAYYYEITTTSSPYYFRFYHNNATQYSAAWADDTYPNIQEAAANGSKIICDQNVNVWGNKSSVKFTGLSGSTIKIWFDYQNKKTWITETTYSVAVTSENAARGTVNAASVMAGKNTAASINATPVTNSGWMFKQWSVTSPASLVSSATTASNSVKATGGSGAVQAQFKHRYILRGSIDADGDPAGGMAGWSATDNSAYTSSITSGVYTITANLTKAKTRYKFRIKDLTDGTAGNGQTGTGDIPNNTGWTLNGSNDVKLTTTAAGTYTFTYTVSTNSLKVVFPTSYTITYEVVGGTGGTMTATVSGETVGTSPGKAAAGSTVRFSASPSSGYEFTKWVDGSGAQLSTSNPYDVSSLAADKTVKAVFTAITYNSGVLKKNGGDEDGSYSVTYMGTSITPSAPTKTGYHVDGYYAEAGTSTHVATAAGVLQNNKSGYTDATGHWNYAGVKDLYAKWAANTYTAENNIDGDGGSNGKYTATYDATSIAINTAPTRTGYNLTGFHAYGRGANTLANTAGALSASQSENKTGGMTLTNSSSQWIYDGNDVTIFADWSPKTYSISLDQEGGASGSTSVTMTYDASTHTAITNPTKTGYTFGGYWTGDNGTGSMVIATDGTLQASVDGYTGAGGIWIKDATCTLYAKWTPNNYAVTLSTSGETGYGSSAPSNQTATYGTALPTITPPVGAAGYKFQGYFTSAGGAGTKYYNADGTSAANWNIAEATTLHAYFLEAEITSLEHETSVAKAEEAELVVNPVLNVVPENYIAICWTLHYADNNNPVDGEHWSVTSYTEGGTKPNQVKYTFTNLASGSYYVKATLRKSASTFSNDCTDGTKMMDIHGDFHVVGNNTVTVRYLTTDFGSDFALKAPTEVEVEAMSTAEITAPEIPGYTFNRWYLGDGISKESGEYTSATITISATYDGVITARYAKKKMVYFNNTVGWDTVFVYFYNGAEGNKYWDNGVGAGANQEQSFNGNKPFYQGYYGGMKRVAPGSNIWYFDYLAAGFSEGNISSKISFAAKDQAINKSGATDAEAFFYETEAIFRDDFDPANLPMYVPLTSPTTLRNSSTTKYYDQGYWMNYPESTGYELRFYNKRATDGSGAPYELISKRHKFEFTGDKTLPMSVSLDLEAGHDYYFKIYRVDGTYYGNNNQMTNGHSGDEGQPAWEFKTGTENAWVTASGAGNYTFTLTYGIDFSSNYNYLVGVRYPESTGDFRVLYSDAVRVTNHDSNEGKSWLASYVIPKTTESDTVSFFVRKASSPKIKAQKCTATYENDVTTVTWTDENEGADLLPDTISADGVYNFIFTKEEGELVLSAVEPYTGNFYIRVDGAGTSNWDNFRAADHLMPYSDYSFKQEDNPYSHYFTQWYEPNPEGKSVDPKNIKFVVANDYSACVSDTIVRDGIADNYVDANGWLSGRNANIRFMYNYKTNVASRRYIDGAQESGSEFLLLIPKDDDMIFDAETDGNAYSQVTFSDKGNWLYEANVWVVPGTTYKLKSNFGVAPNLVEQYFKGAADGDGEFETLVGGSGESRLQIRLLYDFKTNRIVSAYIPSSTISSDLAINADVMFIREGHGDMQQLTFENKATLSAITNVYSVLRFNKWTLNNRYTTGEHGLVADPKSIYERSLYFVSFPFDVKLSDVFGFGTYWDEWYIEYYDGAARAKNGFWIDSDSYWKYVTPAMKDTFTLKAGQGYIFGLDLDYLECYGEGEGQQANIWKNIQTADFIFPGNVSSISNSSVTYTLPAHTCTINRGTGSGNRTIADSHWNVLGVPTYLNTTSVTFEETTGDWMTDGKPKYIYSWNPQDNSLTPTSAAGFTYHSMNAYVVQYYGNVTFSTSVSAAAAPRRNPEYRGEYEFRLEIQKNDEALDQTYVRLSDDEEVTANFEFGYDLTKAQTGRAANLYTIIEGYLEAAGNTLPLTNQTTIVPVGVKVNAAGDFTFSMPDGTEGIGVTLIDNETGIRTSLSALEYTVNLEAGTYDNRFYLEISPIVQNPTGIEDVTGDESQVTGARKVIIDQKMYIIRDGKMFDAQGRQVK